MKLYEVLIIMQDSNENCGERVCGILGEFYASSIDDANSIVPESRIEGIRYSVRVKHLH